MGNKPKPGVTAEAIRHWDEMEKRYQTTITRQREAIDRILKALSISESTFTGIEEEAKDLRQARNWAGIAKREIREAVARVEEDK